MRIKEHRRPSCAACGKRQVSERSPTWCPPCNRAFRCPVCEGRFPGKPAGEWCRFCTDAMASWNKVMSAFPVRRRKGADLLDALRSFERKAEAGLPLFTRHPWF